MSMMQLGMISVSVKASAFLISLQAIRLLLPLSIVRPQLSVPLAMDTSSWHAARSLPAALLPFAVLPSLAQWPLCLAVQHMTVSDVAILAAILA